MNHMPILILDRLGDMDSSRRMIPSMTNHTTNHNGEGDEDLEQANQSVLISVPAKSRRGNMLYGKNIEEKRGRFNRDSLKKHCLDYILD